MVLSVDSGWCYRSSAVTAELTDLDDVVDHGKLKTHGRENFTGKDGVNPGLQIQ